MPAVRTWARTPCRDHLPLSWESQDYSHVSLALAGHGEMAGWVAREMSVTEQKVQSSSGGHCQRSDGGEVVPSEWGAVPADDALLR